MHPFIKAALLIAAAAVLFTSCDGLFVRRANAVTNTYDFDGPVTELDIDTSSSEVRVIPSKDGKISVVCYEADTMLHDVTLMNGLLKIRRRSGSTRSVAVNIRLEIIVSLPPGNYDRFDIETSSGSIDVSEGFTVTDAVLEASSGAIRCSADVRGQLLSTTSSGSQYMENASCRKIRAKSSSGSVNAENLRGEDMEFEASSGSVRLTDVVADKDLRIETSSGSVRLDRCDARDINIKASSGSVKGSLLTGKVFKVKTGSGSAKYPEDGNNGTCTVITTSGSVNITVEP